MGQPLQPGLLYRRHWVLRVGVGVCPNVLKARLRVSFGDGLDRGLIHVHWLGCGQTLPPRPADVLIDPRATIRLGSVPGDQGMTEAYDVPMHGGGSRVDVVWPDTYLSHYVCLACAGDPRRGSHSQSALAWGCASSYAPRRSEGDLIWKLPLEARIKISSAFADGRYYVRASDRELIAYDTKRRYWLIWARHSPAFSAGALRQAWRLFPAHYSGLICVASPQRQGDVFHHFGRKSRCLRAYQKRETRPEIVPSDLSHAD